MGKLRSATLTASDLKPICSSMTMECVKLAGLPARESGDVPDVKAATTAGIHHTHDSCRPKQYDVRRNCKQIAHTATGESQNKAQKCHAVKCSLKYDQDSEFRTTHQEKTRQKDQH